jgi:hypothetical protein
MTEMVKKSASYRLPQVAGHSHLTDRATFVKGDPYIRDMKHTS